MNKEFSIESYLLNPTNKELTIKEEVFVIIVKTLFFLMVFVLINHLL